MGFTRWRPEYPVAALNPRIIHYLTSSHGEATNPILSQRESLTIRRVRRSNILHG